MNAGGLQAPSQLQIWLIDLDEVGARLEAVEVSIGLLAESERAWNSPAPADTRRWRSLARIALRLLLAGAGAEEARGAEFTIDARGKPSLRANALAFNAAHSRGRALIAIAGQGPLGIDLEQNREVQLSEGRRQLIVAAGQAIATKAARDGFLSAWTCLEAFAKARGSGIGALLTELGITVSGFSKRAPDVAGAAITLRRASGLDVVPLALSSGLYGAVAGPRDVLTGCCRVFTLDVATCDRLGARLSEGAR